MREIECNLFGVPCLIRVGDDEEYTVLDMWGRPAQWLAVKITDKINDDIIELIRGTNEVYNT